MCIMQRQASITMSVKEVSNYRIKNIFEPEINTIEYSLYSLNRNSTNRNKQ